MSSCTNQAKGGYSIENQIINFDTELASRRSNAQLMDSAIKLLLEGDLVLRTGNDVTSYMLTQTNQHDKTYSHCGLVKIEHGYPFIYHSIGGEDNPDEELRRDSAHFWFSPANNLGFGIARFDLDSDQYKSLSEAIVKYYNEKRLFDMDFDMATDERLYCAEFIYKAVSESVHDKELFELTHAFGHIYVSVENLYRNQHTKLVWQVRYK